MRTLTARLLPFAVAAALAASAESQPLTQNFDSVAGLGAAGWVFVNNGAPAGSTSWFQGNPAVFASQTGASDSYVASNLNGATFGGNLSDWLLTPTLTNLQNGTVLTFYTRTETTSPAADRLEVRLSTNGASTNVGATDASVGDFTTLLLSVNPSLTVAGYPGLWTLFTVTLAGLPAGPNSGRIAFRHVVPDTSVNADFVGIDTVSVLTCGPAPPMGMNAPSAVGAGSPNRVASVASIGGATYLWTISNGTITSGQGTNQITFTAGTAGAPLDLTATATVGGCPAGAAAASVTVLPVGSGVQLYPVTPCRILDTRSPVGPLGGPALAAAGAPDRTFTVSGVCGIPAGAAALSVNVTVTNPMAPGNLLLYRGNGSPPAASTINFGAGQTRANNLHLQLATDGSGTFKVSNAAAGTVDLILDVNGYYQ